MCTEYVQGDPFDDSSDPIRSTSTHQRKRNAKSVHTKAGRILKKAVTAYVFFECYPRSFLAPT
jgi:hypothetical protein